MKFTAHRIKIVYSRGVNNEYNGIEICEGERIMDLGNYISIMLDDEEWHIVKLYAKKSGDSVLVDGMIIDPEREDVNE